MATSNVILSKTWTKLADDSDDPVTVTFLTRNVTSEFALVATETEPTVHGHQAQYPDVITRTAIGDGYLYARIVGEESKDACRVVVTK